MDALGQCPYKVLQVDRNASLEEIKRAFHKMALSTHPDKNPNGEQMFKKVNAAYAILMNKVERRKYDAQMDRRSHSSCDFRADSNPSSNGGRARPAAFDFRNPQPKQSAAATRDFVNNIMREDREREMKARASKDSAQSFASWYKNIQKDCANDELAQEKLKQDLERRANQASYEEFARKERMRDIEEELVRDKEKEAQQRDMEFERTEAMRKAYERRKQEVQDEIESQEKDLKDRLNRLGAKWAKDSELNRGHPHSKSAPTFGAPRHTAAFSSIFSSKEEDTNGGKPDPASHSDVASGLGDRFENSKNDQKSKSWTENVASSSPSTCVGPFSTPHTATAAPSGTAAVNTSAEDEQEEDDQLERTLTEVRMQRAALRACRAQMKAEEAQLWREVHEVRAERLAAETETQTGFRYATPLDYSSAEFVTNSVPYPPSSTSCPPPRHHFSSSIKPSAPVSSGNMDRFSNVDKGYYRPSSEALREARRELAAEEAQGPALAQEI